MVEGPPNTTETIETGPLAGLEVGGCYKVQRGRFILLETLKVQDNTCKVEMARYPQVPQAKGLKDLLVIITPVSVVIKPGYVMDTYCVQLSQSQRTPGLRVDDPKHWTLYRLPSVYWPCPDCIDHPDIPRLPRFRELRKNYSLVPPKDIQN